MPPGVDHILSEFRDRGRNGGVGWSDLVTLGFAQICDSENDKISKTARRPTSMHEKGGTKTLLRFEPRAPVQAVNGEGSATIRRPWTRRVVERARRVLKSRFGRAANVY